jgi:hypothetical protein
MAKATKPNPWDAADKPTSVAKIAEFLDISPQRVRQIIKTLKAKPVDRIGNVPFYDHYTWLLIRNRNKKPGPHTNGKTTKKAKKRS